MVRPSAVLVVLVCAALGASAARAPSPGGAEGRVLYTRYCSSCHGLDGDGHGPVASVLSRPPTDLRRLGDRFGQPLDADRLARWIDGREDVAAHGTREMPVWGERFRAPQGGIDPRIRSIIDHLQAIQAR